MKNYLAISFITALIGFTACDFTDHNVSLPKNAPVYANLTFIDFYSLQINESKASYLAGHVIQMQGYFKYYQRVHHRLNKHLGKFQASLGANTNTFSEDVDCFFCDSIPPPKSYSIVTLKGIMFKEGGYIGLKNCIVMDSAEKN